MKPELEFVNAQTAHADFSRYVAFVKDFSTKETPKMSELTMVLSVMQDQLNFEEEQ